MLITLFRTIDHSLRIYIEKENTQLFKEKMQLVALATALAFILVVFRNSPPYIDTVYAERIIEHGP